MITSIVGIPFTFYVGGNIQSVVIKELTQFIATSAVTGMAPLHSATFTPSTTGIYSILTLDSNGDYALLDYLQVVPQDIFSALKDINDGVLGSWSWDKTTNILTLYKSDGTALATYNAQSNPDSSFRQRV
jgi:hypothetical protein